MISKPLLFRLLKSVTHIDDIKLFDDFTEKYVFRYFYKSKLCQIETFRLVQFAKMYAIEQGYFIQSGYDGSWFCEIRKNEESYRLDSDLGEEYAVFSACQSILDINEIKGKNE